MQAERPMTVNRVHEMLSRRYYIGYVTYEGVEYEGKHEPLTSRDLFERVQQHVHANQRARDRTVPDDVARKKQQELEQQLA